MATDHGRYFQYGGSDLEGERRGRLRRGVASLVVAAATRLYEDFFSARAARIALRSSPTSTPLRKVVATPRALARSVTAGEQSPVWMITGNSPPESVRRSQPSTANPSSHGLVGS